ncbi:hypothetical protein [Chitinophaga sp. MM2321]|uniref:hypothetical protein n=1 Tax=Chitinophaga sp. MM2321 TaxID=3137178 RepID=UPI0032D568E4
MQIIDLYNHAITVTDLADALKQAAAYKNYRYTDAAYAIHNAERKRYWTDLYQKLLELKNAKNL